MSGWVKLALRRSRERGQCTPACIDFALDGANGCSACLCKFQRMPATADQGEAEETAIGSRGESMESLKC